MYGVTCSLSDGNFAFVLAISNASFLNISVSRPSGNVGGSEFDQ
jgi:hypothetical protein